MATIVRDPIRPGAHFIDRQGTLHVITQVSDSTIRYESVGNAVTGSVRRGSAWFDLLRPGCEHQASGWIGHPDDQAQAA